MKQEHRAHNGDDGELLDQLVREVVDRALDETGTVVHRDDLHPCGQALLQDGELVLHRLDGGKRVLARAHHDHAADRFALAVELADAAAHLRPELDACHVAEAYRHAGIGGHQGDRAEIVQGLQIARSAHHVLGLAQLQHRAAGLLVAAADRLHHAGVRNAVGRELVRIEHHLVLAYHAADRRHLGHVGYGLEFELEEPVLQGAQLREVLRAGPVDQRILVDPAHAGRIRPDR